MYVFVEVVKWYEPDRFCFFLGGNSNERKNCGLGLELDLNSWPEDLELRISESEDLEEEDFDLLLWDLTTSLHIFQIVVTIHQLTTSVEQFIFM